MRKDLNEQGVKHENKTLHPAKRIRLLIKASQFGVPNANRKIVRNPLRAESLSPGKETEPPLSFADRKGRFIYYSGN